MSLTDGTVVSDASLPALQDTTVSSPTGVVGAGDGIVLVAAQSGGNLVEAFRAPDNVNAGLASRTEVPRYASVAFLDDRRRDA